MKQNNQKRRMFLKSAAGLGAAGALPMMAAAAESGTRPRLREGIRAGNLYFSSGLTGVRKDPLAFGGDIKETYERQASRWSRHEERSSDVFTDWRV
jgi:phosphodiesterase/alkaline phosphatase D-like protein